MGNYNRKEALTAYLGEYKMKLNRLMDAIEPDILEQIVSRFIQAFREDKTIYICGNGGSAATASHMNVDFGFFVRYFSKKRMKIRSLTDNVPFITAIGNDNGYEDVFVEQMRDQVNEGDVLLGISASGNSMNVINAIEFGKQQGMTTIGFVGFSGGKLKDAADIVLFTPNPKGEYGPIEDLHMILDHLMVTFLEHDKEFLEIGNA